MIISRNSAVFLALSWLFVGCTTLDSGGAKKAAPIGLISTPVSYYSTAKAKYLGTKYKENLDRIIEQIVQNPKTAPLQFANNISSVGGIGFFTHSATKTADERYLEVVLATPETFDTKGEYSEKVHRLFSMYGFDLLRILNGDGELYEDRELSGYGLNLAWRNVVADANGRRVMLARAIIYLPKDKVRNYLRSEIKQNDLLADGIIFGEEEDKPLTLVSYRPQSLQPDFRPAIREDNLTVTAESQPSQTGLSTNEKMAAAEADGPDLVYPVPPGAVASIKQETDVALEAWKDSENTVPGAPLPAAGSEETPNSTGPITARPSERLQSNRPTAELNAGIKPSVPNTADKKTESKPTTKSPAKVPDIAVEPQAVATAGKPSVLPKPIAKTAIDPAQDRRADVEPTDVAKTTKASPSDASITALPAITEINSQRQTPKPIGELKDKTAEPLRALPAEVTSVPHIEESKTNPLPQLTVPNQSQRQANAREAKTLVKPIEQLAPKEKSEPTRNEIATSKAPEPKPTTEVIARVPERAAPQMPKVEGEPNTPPAKTAVVQKNLGETAREIVSDTPAKVSSDKVSNEAIAGEKKALPVASTKATVPTPAVPEKIASAPSVQSERQGIDPNPQPLQEPIAWPPGVELAQKPAVEPVVNERKQVERFGATKTATSAKPIQPAPSPESKSAASSIGAAESPTEKRPPEQLALLKKPADVIVETKPAVRAAKPLEGFVIQIAFNDKDQAQRWAETMERRGYAVSITEAGTEGALRVRLGNFAVRDEAERQLRTFKQEGMNGIIINLPQGFRPSHASVP